MAVFNLAPMSLVLHCQLDLILHDYAMHTRHGVDLWVSIVLCGSCMLADN